MQPRILVTGHGGFLGAAVCRWLLAHGYRVRGMARQKYAWAEASGMETHQGDLRDAAAVDRACEGVSGIIHTAAIAGVWGPRKLFTSINVDATQHLLNAATQHGIQAFVYSSSPSVTFDGSPQCGIDESTPYPTKWLCDYPRTKAIAERTVLQANDPTKLLTCSLRPHLIWGEGDPHLIPRLILRCRQGRLRRVGNGENLIDTVHVENAAHAHGLALERLLANDPNVGGKPYFITDGHPIACWEWISQILLAAGQQVPTQSITLPAAYRLGQGLEFLYAILRRTSEPPMTRFVALQLGVDHHFSIARARQDLGYEPLGDRATFFDRMAPWLRTLGS